MNKLTLEVSKSEFKKRVKTAIEDTLGSLLNKKSTQIINKAVVTILHGGNKAGQNEHNIDQFWDSKSEPLYWQAIDSIYYEGDQVKINTHIAKTKQLAEIKLFTTVISNLSDKLSTLCTFNLTEVLNNHKIKYTDLNIFKEENLCLPELEEHEVEYFLNHIENEDYNTQKCVFNYILNMSEIFGIYKIEETKTVIQEEPSIDQMTSKYPKSVYRESNIIIDKYFHRKIGKIEDIIEVKETESKIKDITIHTIIIKNKSDEDFDGIDNIEVITTIDPEEHDNDLINLFRSNSMTGQYPKSILLESDAMTDKMDENKIDESFFDEYDFEETIDWMCSNIRPNILIDLIPELTFNMVEVEVQYKN